MDAFKIGILIKVTNQASSVLGAINKDFVKSEMAAKRLTAAMKDLKLAAGLGLVAGGLAYGIEKAIKPAEEYQHQLVTLNSTLRDHAKMVTAVQAAWATSSEVKTTSATENLKAIADLIPALNNNFDHVVANLSTVQKLGAVITNLGGSQDQAFDIAKALETRGAANDPSRFTAEAGMMAQVAEYTHNRVNAKEYLNFIRQSAPFATGFTTDFLYKLAPTLIQDRGGFKAGTGLASFENVLAGGRMTKAAAGVLQQLNLLDAGALAGARQGAAGTLQLAKGKQVRGADLAVTDPFQWVQQYLMPALIAKGINDPKQQEMIVAKMFSNINAERMAIEFMVNRQRYIADAGGISGTENPLAAYARLSKTDPMMLNKQLMAQWNDVLIRLGNTILPILIPATVKLINGLDKLVHVMDHHPVVTKMAGEMALALTALTAFSAGIVLFSAALKATGIAGAGAGGMGIAGKLGVLGAAVALSPAAHTFGEWAGQYTAKHMDGLFRAEHWLLSQPLKAVDSAFGTSLYAPIPARGSTAQPPVVVQIDGRTIATVLSRKQADMMNGPSTGSSQFDPRQGYLPAAP